MSVIFGLVRGHSPSGEMISLSVRTLELALFPGPRHAVGNFWKEKLTSISIWLIYNQIPN